MTDDELTKLFATMSEENRRYFEGTVERLATELGSQRTDAAAFALETRQSFADVRQSLDETRRFFETTTESLRDDIQAVAEVAAETRAALHRHSAELREEIRRSAAETQAMIKFSHTDLDRRVQSLEDARGKQQEAIADLQARVDRIESSAH